ncbi:MAG TPA: alpha/beta fold hydrolase [Gemmatimonadaceae bacterium]|nr:alpha/beta fold hydrolase [Gemmatimonadaceae bacterium]
MKIQLAFAAVVLSATVASSQTAERASFYLISHTVVGTTDTAIVERSSRTPAELTGEFLDRGRGGRLSYVAALSPDGLVTRLVTHYYRSATDTVGDQSTFVIGGDSVVAQIGSAAPARIPSVTGALAIVNPSIAFMEQITMHARAMGGAKQSFPLFILGVPQPVPVIVTWVGSDSATLDYAGVSMHLAVSPTGRVQGGGSLARGLTIIRGGALDTLVASRRDYSAPRDAPYTAEEVVVRTPAGLRLSGTLTIPRGRVTGRAPAVVTITGSGPEDRDEESAALKGYRPFRELADTLGRRGIAVLRLDDRGVNGSDIGPRTATSRDFADDIRAGVAYLRARPEIDPARIALVGHSEGGMIAPMVASTDSMLRAIVLMAGTASTGREILRAQQVYAVDSMARLSGAAREAALARSARATDSLAASTPWMKFFLEYDPTIVARRVKSPVLILQGATDHQVPPTEAEKLAAAFRAGGNARVFVRAFPETNHLFVADPIGGFDYGKLPSLHVRPDVLGAIADWLDAQFR